MRYVVTIIITALLFCPSLGSAQTKEIIAEGAYNMGDGETPSVAESRALLEAKRTALEQAGTYVESYSKVKDFQLTEDEIKALTSGLIEVTVLNKKRTIVGDGFRFWVKIKARVQIEKMEEMAKKVKDKPLVEDYKKVQENYNKLAQDIEELKKQLAEAKNEKEREQVKAKITDGERQFQTNEQRADILWKKWDKIKIAMGGLTARFSDTGELTSRFSDVGNEIATKESVNRADIAALLADELKIDQLLAGRIPVKNEIYKIKSEFTPADVLNHRFKEEVFILMKWGIRGLEPQYDQTTKTYLFKPDSGVTRKEMALVLEDVLIKLTGDEKIATAYFGQEKSPFPDVPATAPWYNAFMNMTIRGLMEPDLEGFFRPDDLVDGAEAILAIRVLRERLKIN